MGVLVLVLVSNLLVLATGISANYVSGIISFGDSSLDVGNNNYLATPARANQPPYGRISDTGMPTGRFSDGELIPDIIAKRLNLPFAPAYLDPNTKGRNLAHGMNFASGAAGILPSTSTLMAVASFELQILWFKLYSSKLRAIVGLQDANDILKNALYFIGAGANDYALKRINPEESLTDPTVFQQRLINKLKQYIEEIYSIGARKFVILSLPPIGCTPAEITLEGGLITRRCIDSMNKLASDYNLQLKNTTSFLETQLPAAKFIYLDLYSLMLDLVQNPIKYGFTVTDKGCCGTGLLEFAASCHQASIGTCANASTYVYFDAAHPSSTTYKIVAEQLMLQLTKWHS